MLLISVQEVSKQLACEARNAFGILHKAYDCGHDGCEPHFGTSLQSEERNERTQSHECAVSQPERLYPLEKSASALRHRRLVEIKLELADLMKRCT